MLLAHPGGIGAVERNRVEIATHGVVEDRLAMVCPHKLLLPDVGGVEDEADQLGGVRCPLGRAQPEQPHEVIGADQSGRRAAARSDQQ
jgi:hypothetical protein